MIGLRDSYLVIGCWLGVASVGAAGETGNVSHEIQPDGRLARAMSAPATRAAVAAAQPSRRILGSFAPKANPYPSDSL
jgi:hypothetical protein